MEMRPDGFTGAMMAVESIEDARVILHGPGGCRYRHISLSREAYPRANPKQGRDYDLPFFFMQSRIPCTYLDSEDYIRGASQKIGEALPIVASKGDSLIVIIDSPGAALIGDDHERSIVEKGLKKRALSLDRSLVSVPLSFGFDTMMRDLIDWISLDSVEKIPYTVNVLGYSVLNKDWKRGLEEISTLLELMGVKIISSPGSGCSLDDLKNSAQAFANLVIIPEYGLETAKYYKEKLGTDYLISVPPVGFDATEVWIKKVAAFMNVDPSSALERLVQFRSEACTLLSGDKIRSNMLRGSTFSINGDASVVLQLTKWLYDYLYMIPVSVIVEPGGYIPAVTELKLFLDDIGCSEIWNKECSADILYSGGDSGRMQVEEGRYLAYVDIGSPFSREMNFIHRSIIGCEGAMYILDNTVNGL